MRTIWYPASGAIRACHSRTLRTETARAAGGQARWLVVSRLEPHPEEAVRAFQVLPAGGMRRPPDESG